MLIKLIAIIHNTIRKDPTNSEKEAVGHVTEPPA
jgi:hypothetical protein